MMPDSSSLPSPFRQLLPGVPLRIRRSPPRGSRRSSRGCPGAGKDLSAGAGPQRLPVAVPGKSCTSRGGATSGRRCRRRSPPPHQTGARSVRFSMGKTWTRISPGSCANPTPGARTKVTTASTARLRDRETGRGGNLCRRMKSSCFKHTAGVGDGAIPSAASTLDLRAFEVEKRYRVLELLCLAVELLCHGRHLLRRRGVLLDHLIELSQS
jgi:hypothetical protein